MSWQDWYTKFAKYYHMLDGASINYSLFAENLDLIFRKYDVKRVLDFACGIGKLDIELKKKGYDVTGVDLNEAMLYEAILNSKKENIDLRLLKGDLRKDVIGDFDIILCTYNYIGHFFKREFIEILKNFKKNLNNKGMIFFDIFNFKFMDKNFKEDLFIDVSTTMKNISITRFNQNELDRESMVMEINQITFIQDKVLRFYFDKWNLKIYTIDELSDILKDDFEIINTYGSIFGDSMFCPYSDDSECIVILAKLKN